MIAHGKLLRDDLSNQGGSPHSGIQAMRDRTTFQDIRQLFPLTGTQLGRASTSMPLQQSFIAVLVPGPDPSVSTGAIHLQSAGDLTGGQPLNTEHDGL